MARRAAVTSAGWARLRARAGLGPAFVPERSPGRVRLGWATALFGPIVVTAILLAVDEPGRYRPSAWYLLLVVGSALLAGRRAFVACTTLCVVGFWWAVLLDQPRVAASDILGLLGLATVAFLVGLIVDRLDHAARAELEATVTAELAAALEQAQRIAHIGSWEWDRASDTMARSREMYAILGVEPETAATEQLEDVLEYVHPDDREQVMALQRRTVEESLPFEVEQRIVRPDGTIRQLLVRGEPIVTPDGEVVGMRGVSQDVTEQRESELALAAAREELYESELKRLRDSHRVDALQEAVLPHELPQVDWLEADACYTPATADLAIGGDWYDVFVIDPCRVAFTVGDVSGHGVEAAALMGQLRNALRAYAFEDPEPAAVVGRLNRLLCRLEVDSFATALYGLISPDAVLFTVAGHPSPVAFERGSVRVLPGATGPLLGVTETPAYDQVSHPLAPGSGLLVYTDGLIERRGEHIDDGTARLVSALEPVTMEHSVVGLCEALVRTLVPAQVARDDVCQILLRIRGGGLAGGQ